MSGAKILEGLKDAVAGNFASVTIEGQRWVRADTVGWRPIASAPKDGTKVLAYWGGDSVITYWAERVGFAGWQPPAMMTIKVSDKSAWNPTHWMPLPPAPEVEA